VLKFSHGLHAIKVALVMVPRAVNVLAYFAKRAYALVPISSGLGNAALVNDEVDDVKKFRARLIVIVFLRDVGCRTSRAGAAGFKEEVGIGVFVVPPPAALRGCSFGRSRRVSRWASGIGGKSPTTLGQAQGHFPAISIAQTAMSHVVTHPVCDEHVGHRRSDITLETGRHWSSSDGKMFALIPFIVELQPIMVQTKSWMVLGRGVECFGPNSNGDTAAALGGDRR
jgi:hypothetical protein